ncbi:MAG: response regulator [Candidatus Acidiferrales bacterium]
MKDRVLVVEDNPLNRELMCDWLEAEGYEVVSAEDLKTAFAEIERHPPQIVLLDIQLGADDGLSLVSWLRKQERLRSIPVIAVTAQAMALEQKRVLMAGCCACISKPVDFKLLSDQLCRWLAVVASSPRDPRPSPDSSSVANKVEELTGDKRPS